MKVFLLTQLRWLRHIERLMASYNDAVGLRAPFTTRSHAPNRLARLAYLVRSFVKSNGGAPVRNGSGPLIIHPGEKTALALDLIGNVLGHEVVPRPVRGIRNRRLLARACGGARPREWLEALSFAWRGLFPLERFTRGYDLRLAFACARLIRETFNASLMLRAEHVPFVVVVSDLSVTRMAVATAANKAGIPVVYLQFAASHAMPPPFLVDAALVLSDDGFEAASKRLAPGGLIVFYDDPQLGAATPMRAPPGNEAAVTTIGVCPINFTEGRHPLSDTVRELACRFPDALISVRPHPNSDGTLRIDDRRAEIRPLDEPIAEFARMCDLVVVGNSSAALKLAWHGCPVVHVGNLDDFGFDTTGYVARDIIYGVSTVEAIDLTAMSAFYARGGWRGRLEAALGTRARAAEADSAQDFKAWLQERLAGAA